MTYENLALETFFKLRFSKKDLTEIDPEVLAAFFLGGHTSNEVSTFLRMISLFKFPETKSEELTSITFIHHSTIFRALSSKIVEFEKSLSVIASCKCTELAEYASKATMKLKDVDEGLSARISRNLRNKSTSHYDFEYCLKRLKSWSDTTDSYLLAHDILVNNFYPIAEKFMVTSEMKRTIEGAGSEDPTADLKAWTDFTYKSFDIVFDFTHSVFTELILPKMSSQRPTRVDMWLPYYLVHDTSCPTVPLLLRT